MQHRVHRLLYLILLLSISNCSTFNPSVTDVLHKFCAFHQGQLAQVLLTPEQQKAGLIVCHAVGDSFGTPEP